jgi:tetraacyldisaccharide 4'-kinase
VVVIGNITVGGTGKTPFIIELSRRLLDLGFKPGVVSRGYGGSVEGVHQVLESDTPDFVGDEPLIIRRRAGVPVVVGKDRVAAVNTLLDNNDCDIVLSDDGLQHLGMYRDLEIVIVDSSRGFGNARCIPAGPLREPVSRLKSVDLVVSHGQSDEVAAQCGFKLVPANVRRLDRDAELEFNEFSSVVMGSNTDADTFDHDSTKDHRELRLHAVAGIGNPERFFTQLERSGLKIQRHPFPDHHAYQQEDFSGWSERMILMTEKDAVKCRRLALPDAWYLSVDAVFSESLINYLNTELKALIEGHNR